MRASPSKPRDYARHSLRTLDAIQIATAIRAGASWFLTNDAGLANLFETPVLVLTSPADQDTKAEGRHLMWQSRSES